MEGLKDNWIYSGLNKSKMYKLILLHLRERLYLKLLC